MAGCLLAALTYFPLFKALTHYVNPALEAFDREDTRSALTASDCKVHIFAGPQDESTATATGRRTS